MSALNAIWGLICIGMVIGAGGWLRMKMGKNGLCGICAMVMLRGVQSWHGAMNMGGSDGYGPCGSGTRAPGCQSTSWICNEASMVAMIGKIIVHVPTTFRPSRRLQLAEDIHRTSHWPSLFLGCLEES